MEFVLFQKNRVERSEIVPATIRNYLKATKLFLEMNFDSPLINWKRITKSLPVPKNSSSDRAPSLSELRTLIKYPDRRIKPIILCMVSGAFRISSWDFLKWKNVTPIKDEKTGEVLAAKMIIYSGEPDEYYCFISPESFEELSSWMLFRQSSGEEVTGESWLMRDLWSTTNFDAFRNSTLGLARYPRKLKSSGIKSLIERAMRAQGLAKPLLKGVKRREWKSGHGYRKFFKSKAEQVMKPANVELLSGRCIGISQSYYKPTENEVLQDYLKAVPILTINQDYCLKIENKQLQEKNKFGEYLIHQKLQERDNQIETLMKRQERTDLLIQSLIDAGHLKTK